MARYTDNVFYPTLQNIFITAVNVMHKVERIQGHTHALAYTHTKDALMNI